MFIVPGIMPSGIIVIHSIVALNHVKEKQNPPPNTHTKFGMSVILLGDI